MSRYLNWSIDYISQHAPGVEFDKKIYDILENKNGTSNELKYAILANYRFNHKNPTILKTEDVEIGEVLIKKEDEDDKFRYLVKYSDISSGEYVDLNYLCEDDVCGSLSGNWTLEDNNQSMYSSYKCSGELIKDENGAELIVKHNSGKIYSMGKVNDNNPIICNYTLFNTIPKMIEKGIKEFTVIEGLERLYPNQHLGYFGEDVLIINSKPQKLYGYYMHGTGMPPSYWWIDDNNKVVIMTTTLLTYVLKN